MSEINNNDDIAIKVNNVSKLYKLYDKPSDRLKESLGLTKKKLYKEHYALHNVDMEIKKGEMIKAKNKIYVVKSVILPTNPAQGDEKISIVVE